MAHGYGYRSDIRLRKENQDTLGVFEFALFKVIVVADGMGGHVGGRQASAIAVRTIHDEMARYESGDVRATLQRAIERANAAIHDAAHSNYRLMGMGTTVVAAVIHRETAHVAWVGDSRAYLVRDGAITPVTRDHTMVNLFVDAELLSPEDAATHPEAHVLSRSLGVERAIEIDLADAITLGADDRLILCTDGVHGALGHDGLYAIDWSDPLQAVDAALDAVISAEGDDNASLVVFGNDTGGKSAPATPPPNLGALGDEARSSAPAEAVGAVRRTTAVPADDDNTVVAMNSAPAAPPLRAKAGAPAARGLPGLVQRAGLSLRSLVLLGVALFVGGGLSYAAFSLSRQPNRTAIVTDGKPAATDRNAANAKASAGTDPGPPKPIEPVLIGGIEAPGAELAPSPVPGVMPTVLTPRGDRAGLAPCLDCTTSYALPSVEAYREGERDPSFSPAFFDAELPTAPRRPPVSGKRFDRRPPGGPEQAAAVQAIKSRRCREALDAVQTSVNRSIDFASLYSPAWFCFNDVDQAALDRARTDTFDDFAALLAHFEGDRPVQFGRIDDPEAMQSDTDVVDPYAGYAWTWTSPAVGGIEYRLGRVLDVPTTAKRGPPGLAEVMTDLAGESSMVDHLAADLLLELTAAAALAAAEERTPRMVDVWARRVYVSARILSSPVADLLRAHRGSDVMPLAEAMFAEATAGDLPAPVAEALEEGRSAAPQWPIAAPHIETVASSLPTGNDADGASPVAVTAPLGDASSASGSRGPTGSTPGRRTSNGALASRSRPSSGPSSRRTGSRPDVIKIWYPHQAQPRILSARQREGETQGEAAVE